MHGTHVGRRSGREVRALAARDPFHWLHWRGLPRNHARAVLRRTAEAAGAAQAARTGARLGLLGSPRRFRALREALQVHAGDELREPRAARRTRTLEGRS